MRSRIWLCPLIVLVAGLVQIQRADIPLSAEGFLDAQTYAEMSQDLLSTLRSGRVDRHRITRVVPSLLVSGLLKIAGVPARAENVFLGFQILNLLAVMGCAVVWIDLHRFLRLPDSLFWLGFVWLCLGFTMLKTAYHAAVQVDTVATLLAVVLVWSYYRRNRWVAALCFVVGALTFTGFTSVALPLLVFPRRSQEAPEPGSRWALPAALLLGVAYAAAGIYGIAVLGNDMAVPQTVRVEREMFPLSLVSMTLLLVLGAWQALDLRSMFQPGSWWRQVSLPFVGLIALSLIGITLGFGQFPKRPLPGMIEAFTIPDGFVTRSLTFPLVGLVGQVAFWGPAVVLAVLLWPAVCARAHRLGLGMSLLLFLTVILCTNSESRHNMISYVAMAVLILEALAVRQVSRATVALLVAVSLVYSRFWIRYGDHHAVFAATSAVRAFTHPAPGPWMNETMWAMQAAVALAVAAVLALLLFGRVQESARA